MTKLYGFLAVLFLGGGFGFAIFFAGEEDDATRFIAALVFAVIMMAGLHYARLWNDGHYHLSNKGRQRRPARAPLYPRMPE